jgi:hypothetical protein
MLLELALPPTSNLVKFGSSILLVVFILRGTHHPLSLSARLVICMTGVLELNLTWVHSSAAQTQNQVSWLQLDNGQRALKADSRAGVLSRRIFSYSVHNPSERPGVRGRNAPEY